MTDGVAELGFVVKPIFMYRFTAGIDMGSVYRVILCQPFSVQSAIALSRSSLPIP